MLRLITFGAGLIFALALLVALVQPREAPTPDLAKELTKEHPREVAFHHDGPFGTFDRAQLQRGFQVYKEVCSACHSMSYVRFGSLQDIGFSEAEVKALAKNWTVEVPTINETGEPVTRKAMVSDLIPGPYANETAARAANNNALPPDLSLLTKARHHGTAHLYSVLTGYADAPGNFPVADGLHFNPYFSGAKIAMPPPLSDDQVTYAQGTKATTDQMAQDVAAFLTWAAEPKLEARKRMGVGVLAFLGVLIVLSFISYRRTWKDVKGH